MRGLLGPALFVAGAALIALGVAKRRKRRQRVHPPGSIRPEFAGMSNMVRPLLLWTLGFFAAETTLHYFMMGGSSFLSPFDFAGILFLFAAFAAYVVLAVIPPVVAPEKTGASR
jgi:hypothetical protein